MKITILEPCKFWDEDHGYVVLFPGDTADLAEEHAQRACREHWAKPYTAEDAASGAPPREKLAAAHAPERKTLHLNGSKS